MTCGVRAYCGRPAGHRGHHGGWRSGVAVIATDPTIREQPLGELTLRQVQVVAESLVHGRYADVASCLGIAEQTVKNHAASALAKTGAASMTQLAMTLGWVTLPSGVGACGVEAAS